MENPFDTPVPRGVRVVQGILRVVVAIQCWGMVAARLHQQQISPVATFLAAVYQIPDPRILQVETAAAYALFACGLLTLVRPCWPVLLPTAGWFLATALAPLLLDPSRITALNAAIHTVRFAAPMALLLIDFWPPALKPTLNFCRTSIALLRVAVAITFAAEGLIALRQFRLGGEIVDRIAQAAAALPSPPVDSAAVQESLGAIGTINISAAIVLLLSRSRACAAWMAVWGLLAACSHFVAFGAAGYHETLLRAADAGAPLAVLAFWLLAIREQQPQFIPEDE